MRAYRKSGGFHCGHMRFWECDGFRDILEYMVIIRFANPFPIYLPHYSVFWLSFVGRVSQQLS
jgi:hypothetical protein